MFRLLLPLLLTAAQPTPVPIAARDVGTITLASDAETRWIPFTLTGNNQIRFTVMLDGAPVTAILDTGVSYTLLSRAAADPARVRPVGQAQALGGAVPIGWMPTATLGFGGLTRTGGGVTVADFGVLAASGGAKGVTMLVGRDLLAGQALDIDFAARRFRLLPSGRLPFLGQAAPLRISSERLVYEIALTLGDKRIAPVIVDTGDGGAVTLARARWRAAAPAGIRTTDALAYGLAGPVISDLAILPTVGIGVLQARNVEVRIEPTGGFSDTIRVAGRIGTGLLSRYRVLLDPGAGRMVLSPQAGADQAPRRSTSGLLVSLDRDRLTVRHVMRGSPAAMAGWRAGEVVCQVDGVAISPAYAGSPAAGWTTGASGRQVRFTLCDGSQRTLTLAAFY